MDRIEMKLIRVYIDWQQVLKKLISRSNIKLCQDESHLILRGTFISIISPSVFDDVAMIIEKSLIEGLCPHVKLLFLPFVLSYLNFLVLLDNALEENQKTIVIQSHIHSNDCILSLSIIQITKAPASIYAHILISRPFEILYFHCVLSYIVHIFISHQ